jgi:hypothetical protein
MESQSKKYQVKTHIVGGGLALHEGQIVVSDQLGEYADWLKRQGAIVEVAEQPHSKESPAARAYPG